jgi:hypothetical protein
MRHLCFRGAGDVGKFRTGQEKTRGSGSVIVLLGSGLLVLRAVARTRVSPLAIRPFCSDSGGGRAVAKRGKPATEGGLPSLPSADLASSSNDVGQKVEEKVGVRAQRRHRALPPRFLPPTRRKRQSLPPQQDLRQILSRGFSRPISSKLLNPI